MIDDVMMGLWDEMKVNTFDVGTPRVYQANSKRYPGRMAVGLMRMIELKIEVPSTRIPSSPPGKQKDEVELYKMDRYQRLDEDDGGGYHVN